MGSALMEGANDNWTYKKEGEAHSRGLAALCILERDTKTHDKIMSYVKRSLGMFKPFESLSQHDREEVMRTYDDAVMAYAYEGAEVPKQVTDDFLEKIKQHADDVIATKRNRPRSV